MVNPQGSNIAIQIQKNIFQYWHIVQKRAIAFQFLKILPNSNDMRTKSKVYPSFPLKIHFPVLRINGEGIILYANAAASQLLNAWNVKSEESVPEYISKLVAESLKSNRKIEVDQIFGAKVFSILFAPISSEGYVNIYANDITERKKAEQELRKGELKYLRLFNTSEVGMFRTKLQNSEVLECNEKLLDILGYDREEILGKPAMLNYVDSDRRQELVNILLAEGQVVDSEIKLVSKTGEIKTCLLSSKLFLEEEILEGSIVDITERKKAEEALRRSEERLRLAETAGNVGIWDWNLLSGKLVWTLELEEIYGLKPGDVRVYDDFRRRVHPEDIAIVEARQGDSIAQHKPFEFDFRVTQPSGKLVWVHCRGSAIYDDQGVAVRVFGVNIDITERKKAEAEREIMIEFLKITNASFGTRNLIRAALEFFQKRSGCEAVGVRLKDGDDFPYYETRGFPPEHVLLENKLCVKDDAGCVIRDFKGDPVIECMCGNILCGRFDPSKNFFTEKGSFWANDTTRLLASTTDSDRQVRTRNRCNGEGYESVALIALRAGNDRLGLLQLNDKRKNMFSLESIQTWERIADHLALALSKTLAEEKLREEEEKYRHLSENAPAAIYEIDCKSLRFKSVNDYMCTLSGYSEKELLSMSPFDLLNAESKERFKEIIRKTVASEKINPNVEFGVITKDGRLLWATLSAKLTYKDNELDCAFVVAHDITERKKAEEALIKAEAHYRNLFDNIYEGFELIEVIRNEKGEACDFRYLEVNSAFEKQTGTMASAVLGKTTSQVYPGSEKYWLDMFGNVERTGEPASFENYSEPLKKYYQTYAFPFGKNQVGVLFRDITARKKAELHVIESEAKYRELVDSLPEMVFELDINANVVFANAKAFELTGYSKEDMKEGFNAARLFSPKDAERAKENMKKMLTEDVRSTYEYIFIKKDGKTFPVSIHSNPIIKNGKTVGVRGIAIVLAEGKHVEKKHED